MKETLELNVGFKRLQYIFDSDLFDFFAKKLLLYRTVPFKKFTVV